MNNRLMNELGEMNDETSLRNVMDKNELRLLYSSGSDEDNKDTGNDEKKKVIQKRLVKEMRTMIETELNDNDTRMERKENAWMDGDSVMDKKASDKEWGLEGSNEKGGDDKDVRGGRGVADELKNLNVDTDGRMLEEESKRRKQEIESVEINNKKKKQQCCIIF
jgi:hypothetical protein